MQLSINNNSSQIAKILKGLKDHLISILLSKFFINCNNFIPGCAMLCTTLPGKGKGPSKKPAIEPTQNETHEPV